MRLTENHRQTYPDDARLLRALRVCESIAQLPEDVYRRWLAISTEAPLDENAVLYYPVLVPTHEQAQRINYAGLRNLGGVSFTFNATDVGPAERLVHVQARREITLKIGARVICVRNDKTLGVYNGSTGIVVGMENTQDCSPCVVVQLDDGGHRVKLCKVTFNVLEHEGGQPLASRTQIPLKLGYACTVHCAQGMSLTRGTCDLRGSFTCGQAYTAVSRFRSFEHVVIHRADTIRSANPDCVFRAKDGCDCMVLRNNGRCD